MKEDSLEALILENISKPLAFFDEEGELILSNREWDNFCGKEEGIDNLLNYREFLDKINISDLRENMDYDSVKTKCCCNKTIIVIRKRINTEELSGILVEVEDISNTEESSSNIKRIIKDSMWKIRSSVSNIQNVISLLIDYPSCRLNEECRGLLIETNVELWKLSRYIEKLRLLCLTATDNENFNIKYEKIKAKKFIEEIILYFDPLIKNMPEKPEIDIRVDETHTFFSDYYICFMAISAIIYNAIIYNEKKIKLTIQIDKRENNTIISISDNGIGIKDKDLEKVFSYGFSWSKKEENLAKGAGTELYLVRKLLNLINSEIYFISKENEGTKFEIIIKEPDV